MRQPQTPTQWQEAVDAAHAAISLDACRQYGLVTGGPEINMERCEQIIEQGRARGFVPTEDAIPNFVDAINADVQARKAGRQ
jgi:hypothetical protein